MATNDIRVNYTASAAISDVSILTASGISDGDYWLSEELTDTDPSHEAVRVFYDLEMSAWASGDSLRFRIVRGDAHATEIWDGGLSPGSGTDSSLTSAADVANAESASRLVHVHGFKTNQTATRIKGHFDIENAGPNWALLIGPDSTGISADADNVVHLQYFTGQAQS